MQFIFTLSALDPTWPIDAKDDKASCGKNENLDEKQGNKVANASG
jgi:hypothetical protein